MENLNTKLLAQASTLLIEYRQLLQPGLYRFIALGQGDIISKITEKRIELPMMAEGETYGVLFDFCDQGEPTEHDSVCTPSEFAKSIKKPTLRRVSDSFIRALITHLSLKLAVS